MDGADSLTLAAQLYWEQYGLAISGVVYPDTISEAMLSLTRGGEEVFENVCNRVKIAE